MSLLKMKVFLFSVILVFYSSFTFSEPDYDPYGSNYDYPYAESENIITPENHEDYYSEDDYSKESHSVEVDYSENTSDEIDHSNFSNQSSESRLPQKIPSPGEKIIIVNPRVHAWGAYSSEGQLLRTGLATAGARWCADIQRSCRTKVGVFRIFSLGQKECVSTRYPLGKGGAPMPYCMFFNKNQGIHGSYQVVDGNVSHGCVRLNINDAKWLRYHFANVGTKVIILSY